VRGVDDSLHRSSTKIAPPLEAPVLPEGWRSADREDWRDPHEGTRRRSLLLQVGAVFIIVVFVAACLVWIAAGHYTRGVEALNDHAYFQAVDELSAAKVLGIPYRDARSLEEQARRSAAAEAAARAQEQERVSAVVAKLEDAISRLDAGDSVGVLSALQLIPARDLRVTLRTDAGARQSAGAMAEDLTVSATTALDDGEWGRAARFAAALLLLDPSSKPAATLATRAKTGQDLNAQLQTARDAARRGHWRTALRLALAIVAVRKEFPGAAALIADARVALAPKPKPASTPTQTVAAPTPTSGGSTTSPPPPPPP
jgi:hypothetical protein